MAMLTLRISDELNDRITALAERSGRTKTYFVKKIIIDAIEDLEDEIWAEGVVREHRAKVAKGDAGEWVDFFEHMKELDARDLASKRDKKSSKKPGPNAKKPSSGNSKQNRTPSKTSKPARGRKAA